MRKAAIVVLAVVGTLQMIGDLVGWEPLKAIGAATGASPAPRVFCAIDGYEAFSTEFEIAWTDEAGDAHQVRIDPEIYGRMKGPYNRRNVYGAVLAGGPVLERHPIGARLGEAVTEYALRNGAPLLRELRLTDGAARDVRIRYLPREGSVPTGYTITVDER